MFDILFSTHPSSLLLQTWSVKSGERLAEICGTGLGVKPVIFFNDSVRIASAQENGVLVSDMYVLVRWRGG